MLEGKTAQHAHAFALWGGAVRRFAGIFAGPLADAKFDWSRVLAAARAATAHRRAKLRVALAASHAGLVANGMEECSRLAKSEVTWIGALVDLLGEDVGADA